MNFLFSKIDFEQIDTNFCVEIDLIQAGFNTNKRGKLVKHKLSNYQKQST